MEGLLATQRKQAEAVSKASEDAVSTMREGAQRVRKEMESYLQETLDLAGKAGRIDANLRSREWLNQLLTLLEGNNGIKPGAVKHLGLTHVAALLSWLERHEGSLPPTARADLERVLHALQEVKE